MTWARRLKPVFNFDVTVCEACSGPVRVVACIEDPQDIDAILTHLAKKQEKKFLENTAARIGAIRATSQTTDHPPLTQGRHFVGENISLRDLFIQTPGNGAKRLELIN